VASRARLTARCDDAAQPNPLQIYTDSGLDRQPSSFLQIADIRSRKSSVADQSVPAAELE
jgi:hypothetical protein